MKSGSIIITEKDLREIEEAYNTHKSTTRLDKNTQIVFEFMKKRKLTTALLVHRKLGISRTTAGEILRRLEGMGLVGREEVFLKSTDGNRHRNMAFYVKGNEQQRKNK